MITTSRITDSRDITSTKKSTAFFESFLGILAVMAKTDPSTFMPIHHIVILHRRP